MCGIILTFARKKEIAMSLMGLPLWAWIVFYVLVLLMLVADLKMFGKKGQHEVNVKEALQMTAVWIGVSLVFSSSQCCCRSRSPGEKASKSFYSRSFFVPLPPETKDFIAF